MELMEHFQPNVLIKLELAGINLSITDYIVWMWFALAIVFFFLFFASRKVKLVPSGVQNLIEVVLDFIRKEMVLETMGKEGLPWFPFIATLFIYILVCNLIGLIPASKTPTSLTGTTTSWAIIVFIAYHLVGIKKHGIVRYLKGFIPSGVPIVMAPILFVIEIISHFARPLSLAVRLFANMLAGHTVLLVFTLMAVTSSWWIKVLPFSAIIIMYLFEIFVGFIQAYIFAILAAIYIGTAIYIEH